MLTKKNIVLLVFAAGFAALCAGAPSYPKPEGYISDFAGVLTPSAHEAIRSLADEVEKKTTSEIALVTVRNLDGDAIQSYANELFTRWGIGKKGKDNGLLILLALEERRVWIETGYGLEPILPDGKVGEIIRRVMLPSFRQNDYSRGLLQGTAAVAEIIAQDAGVTITGVRQHLNQGVQHRSQPTIASRIFSGIFLIIFILLFIRHPFLLLFLMSGSRGGRFGGGGFSGGSGGFGGFGGGMSGGGGAGGSW